MKRYFITGTDTGVGKTYVLSLILRYLKHTGISFFVMKPIETGCAKKGDELIPEDAAKLAKIAGLEDNMDMVCPYRFENPVAPYVAAKLEGREIDLQRIKDIYSSRFPSQGTRAGIKYPKNGHKGTKKSTVHCSQQEKKEARIQGLKRPEYIFVEGAGGLMVPVTTDFFMIDFPNFLGLKVILVSRLGLGTLNHTLLSIAELKRRNIEIAGVILNDTEGKNTIAERTNMDILKEFAEAPVLGLIPHNFKKHKELDKHLDLERIL